MERVYSSIDFGSDTIKLVVCEFSKGKLNLLAAASVPTNGIKKGLIVDPISVKKSVSDAFFKVESMLGIKIDKVIANIPSYFSEYTLIKGQTNISGEVITNQDIMKAYENGVNGKISPNQEYVTILPIDFKINDRSLLKTPIGFPGEKLLARAILATTTKKNICSIVTILESLKIEVVDISLGPIGDAFTLKEKELYNQIGVGINIGAEITTVSIYNKFLPVKNSIIQQGGKDIDKKIADYYGLSMEKAKKIKETFALAHTKNIGLNEVYEEENKLGEKLKISQGEVSQIVMEKLKEILTLVKKDINLLTNRQIQYIIVSGGTSELRDLEYLLKEVLHNCVKIGNIKIIGIRNNKYSVAVGNILYFLDVLKMEGSSYSMLKNDDMEDLSSPSRNSNISENSMLGKVFGYFFGE